MKALLLVLTAVAIGLSPVYADEEKTADALTTAAANTPKVDIVLAVDTNATPAVVFPPNTPKLTAFITGSTGTKKGDTVRGAWFTDDVGDVAPPNTKMAESSFVAEEDNFSQGALIIDKDNKWPVGTYRFELYINDVLVTTAKFTIAEPDTK